MQRAPGIRSTQTQYHKAILHYIHTLLTSSSKTSQFKLSLFIFQLDTQREPTLTFERHIYREYNYHSDIYNEVTFNQDCWHLQADLDGIFLWCCENEMKMIVSKCTVISFSKSFFLGSTISFQLFPMKHCTNTRMYSYNFRVHLLTNTSVF